MTHSLTKDAAKERDAERQQRDVQQQRLKRRQQAQQHHRLDEVAVKRNAVAVPVFVCEGRVLVASPVE